MSDPKTSSALAMAAMVEMIAIGQQYQAAVIRGAGRAELDAIRGKAHDMLDAFIDQRAEGGFAVRSILDGHPDAKDLAAEGARRLLED